MSRPPASPEFLTAKELAELLRIKERKVYDLAASGQVPCSKATGKLLFPASDVRDWIDRNRTDTPARTIRPATFLGSHDPLLEWALRQSRAGLATYFDGSLDGLDRFVAGDGIAAGLHVHDSETDQWNAPVVASECAAIPSVLIHWAKRRRGLVLSSEQPAGSVGLKDLPALRFAGRQRGSGSDLLFRTLLARSGVDPDAIALSVHARSEEDAVKAVARGDADAAFGLQSLALFHGLAFVPLDEERFDIVVERRAYFDTPFQRVLEFARTPEFRDYATASGGYDITELGRVYWNSTA